MYLLIILLLSPAAICSGQRYRKSTNPNDEPFLPIHPQYPYNPKLMKRGLEQQQQQHQQIQPPQPQQFAQLTPELYAPKVDAHDSYSASYSQNPYAAYTSLDPYTAKTASATPNALSASSYYQSAYSPYGSNPYNLLNSYGAPIGTSSPTGYAAPGTPGYGASPYPGAAGAYPYYYYPNQSPYYYPSYYNQPPYPPPPPGYPGYPGGPSKHHNDDDDDDEDDKRREKSKKTGSPKNKLRHSDRDSSNNQYVDGANYIISNAKDLDGESSSHRTPSHYNQIEDSDVHPRTVPKTYRLVSISGQQSDGYSSAPAGYIKVQQLEQLMRQALARLLAQNAAQQANLAQIQQEASQQQKDGPQQYVALPATTIAKTGLSYVVNPTILNRVTPGQYNPSQLINTQPGLITPTNKKPTTTVTLHQSTGIYIPPGKSANDQSSSAEYGDYDSSDSVTTRNQGNYQATAEPTRNYPYSTYRPTQQTNLEDVNFGNKQKSKS